TNRQKRLIWNRARRKRGERGLQMKRTARISETGLISTGRSSPLGATIVGGDVNFSVFSRSATGVELLLFDSVDDANPSRAISLDPVNNRTYHYWHALFPGVQPGQIYGYRVVGLFDGSRALPFDTGKLLLDPYGR